MKQYEIDRLNRKVSEDPLLFIQESEAEYEKKIEEAANYFVARKGDQPLILLSGPSGSGKTTTAKKIRKALEKIGAPARYLSMDQYFLPSDEPNIPYNADGTIDYESPYRLDIPLFSRQMQELFQCKKVDTPIYDFASQRRSGVYPLQRQPDELIIVEGIHALNPQVIGSAFEHSSKLYISVRTRLHNARGNLHPSQIRLLRRLLRDRRERGRSFEETMRLLPSVTAGEDQYIMPFKKFAELEFDSFIPYEIAAYRNAVLEELEREPCCDLGGELMEFLQQVSAVEWKDIPEASMLREFIGKP